MNLRVFENAEDMATAVADELIRQIEARKRSVVGLSGGATPRRMYELLGSGFRRGRIQEAELIWVLGDERLVPPYHPESNSRLIQETLFQHGIPERHRFIRFRTDLENPQRIANEFEADLREVVGERPIDLFILGVGEDGHTASLFPGTSALDERERWAVAVDVPQLHTSRLTVTLPVLQGAALRWVLASGASKRAVIEEVQGGADLPVALATRGEGETWWFADREAWDPDQTLREARGGR
ncbi:MAG: 6-phosphogluconolactonase [Thermoanaerobaculia bacterium]